MKANLRPKPLCKGSLISIAAPAGPFEQNRFLKGVGLLRDKGFSVHFEKGIFSRSGYLAGGDHRRAQELSRILADRKSAAVLFARGGYGSQRIVSHLKKLGGPKIVVGSSDLTVVLVHLWKKFGLPSYYGPMVTPHLIVEKNVSRLVQALTNPHYLLKKQKLVAKKIIKPGRATGRLFGGCLSLIISTLGTEWEINTDNSILFLEDTHEDPYSVDRMLTQLMQAGKLKKVRGIVFGTFRRKKILFPASIEAVIRERLKDFRGPILWGIHFGHCPDPLILPFGGKGKIVGNQLILTEGIF